MLNDRLGRKNDFAEIGCLFLVDLQIVDAVNLFVMVFMQTCQHSCILFTVLK